MSVPLSSGQEHSQKTKESQLSFKLLLVAFGFGGCWTDFLSFFFPFYPLHQLLKFVAAGSCKGEMGLCSNAAASCQKQPPAFSRH